MSHVQQSHAPDMATGICLRHEAQWLMQYPFIRCADILDRPRFHRADLLCSSTLLVPVIASGDFAAMATAHFIAAACRAAASGKTSVTSPMALASWALNTRAVKDSSLALPAQALGLNSWRQLPLRPQKVCSEAAGP